MVYLTAGRFNMKTKITFYNPADNLLQIKRIFPFVEGQLFNSVKVNDSWGLSLPGSVVYSSDHPLETPRGAFTKCQCSVTEILV